MVPHAIQGTGVVFLMKSYDDNVLKDLYQVVQDRKNDPREGSYTGYLFKEGIDKILKKVGEECAETIIAAKNKNRDEIIMESADLIYHLTVMLTESDINISDVLEELDRRSRKIGNLKDMRETDKES